MVHKSDDGHLDLTVRGSVVAGRGSDEFDDAETSEILAITVKPVGANRADADLTDASAPAPDDLAPLRPTDDEALKPGFLLRDRFEIVELVHSGGMSHVYKAVDNRRNLCDSELSHVAIKMMRRSVAPQLDARLALEREANKAQRLSHPNIINIYDFDVHDGQFFLVMEWLKGESVNALLRRTRGRRLEPQFAWRVIQGIAAAVQHAHSNNVVHADINPSNIFITDTQDIRLLDFGVARYCGNPEDTTDDRIAWATRTYASPEVLSGSTPVFEDDIFSLACVAYRLLSGTHPFAGLSAIDAKQAGLCVQPIPGLAEVESQTLSRALSYARSDRPGTADALSPGLLAASRSVVADRPRARLPAHWLGVVPLAAIALSAGIWWLWPGGSETEQPAIAETTLVVDSSAVGADATSEPSELDRLLGSAAQAMDEERFLAPVDNNARDLYREALVFDSANPIALRGLRTISDVYVQQVDTELRAGAPERAFAALAIAAETDSENPAIAIVNELFVAQGNRQLADARLAAAEGDFERTAELLSKVERYAHVDVNAINAVRDRIAQDAQERQFLSQLAAADDHIAAGNLTTPAEDNAHALLIELNQDHGTDSRLLASMERLGESLLTRAAFATAAGRFPESAELLDAVDALGVVAPELAAARASLRSAEEKTMDAMIAVPALAESASEESAAPSLATGGEREESLSRQLAAGGLASLSASISDVPGVAPDAVADFGKTVTDEPSEPGTVSMSALDIEKYVAPRFPRYARRRGLTGFVDVGFSVYPDGSTGAVEIVNAKPSNVFDSSVEHAVKQWRFAPRDEELRARVTLRFEQE